MLLNCIINIILSYFNNYNDFRNFIRTTNFYGKLSKVNINNIFLCDSSTKNDIDIVKLLVKSGADVNMINEIPAPPCNGACGGGLFCGLPDIQTPLYNACENEHLEIVIFLVEHNADINARVTFGNTPLHYACFSANDDIVKYLIKNGADINATNYVCQKPDMSYPVKYDIVEL